MITLSISKVYEDVYTQLLEMDKIPAKYQPAAILKNLENNTNTEHLASVSTMYNHVTQEATKKSLDKITVSNSYVRYLDSEFMEQYGMYKDEKTGDTYYSVISYDAADENNDGQNERKIMEMRILQQNRPLHG